MKGPLADHFELLGELPCSIVVLDDRGRLKYCNPRAESFLHQRLCDFQSNTWTERLNECRLMGASEFRCDEWSSLCRMKHYRTEEESLVLLVFLERASLAPVTQSDDIYATRLKELSEMAASIAHEVNNPLTVIYSRSLILLQNLQAGKTVSPEQIKEVLQKVLFQSERVIKIIKGIRSFSRDATQDPLLPTNLKAVLQDCLSLVNPSVRDLGIEIVQPGWEENPVVLGRASDLMQVFLNLLNNAIDSVKGRPFPQVRIEIRVDEKTRIRILDNGEGVSPENEKKIFLPFFTTKPTGSGTGIGLTISSKIVSHHGGRLFLNRRVSDSCFEVELPLPAEIENAA